MSVPLKQLAAFVGLLLLAPIAYRLATGDLTAVDAGIRAAALFGAVVLARRMASMAPGRPVVVPSRIVEDDE